MNDRLHYFKLKEFDSPDNKGSGTNMDFEFLIRLDALRGAMGAPFTINSGYRTPAHNKAVGGAAGSPHTKGMAADISTRGWNQHQRNRLLKYARDMGFRGIGVGRTYIHLDTMARANKQAAWRYAINGSRPKVEIGDLTKWA